MSGLNPFRPRKPDDPTAPPPSSHAVPASAVTSFSFHTAPSAADPSRRPNGLPPPAPPTTFATKNDSVGSGTQQSVSDPFHQDLSTDEENGDDEDVHHTQHPSSSHSRTPSWDDRLRPSGDADSSAASSPRLATPSGGSRHRDTPSEVDESTRYRGSSSVSVRSLTPHGTSRTADSSTTDISQTLAARPVSGMARSTPGEPSPNMGSDSKPPTSRSGNRDKIPPPPPKSHHGKLINPSPGASSSQVSSAKAANRFSFHGSPSESSISPKPAPATADYFSGQTGSQPEQATEPLRRSQSQHKRPPTPPLSRRHSQMRRSKTTLSKPSASRLSITDTRGEETESPPPSPSSWSIASSRTREAPRVPPSSEEAPSRPPLQSRNSGPGAATSTAETEVSTPPSTIPSSKANSTKRASQVNMMPPPPPPRRSRKSSNQSTDSGRRTSLRMEEKPADENEPFVPKPSNAHDILADLTRLQKEVDDLRGHYATRQD